MTKNFNTGTKMHAKCNRRRVVCGSDWHRLAVFILRCSEAKEEEGGSLSTRKSNARNTRDEMA